ncbi:serine/threonine-protein kinase dbf2 [Tilletia horrida]|uniref:non-specific serine/threonine protein kinase n=1 Tax=Tilletia horrida TaxID=155126 RepID=A0AAN6GU10_9BASI|nr:serine/threonine-protein kinase dbf2 [Tilletia horrida]KAK0556231.1 serine/threonine-protein kinase dbf2 [Tilletia horrida]KAK0569105.1 serine/threonine-protein kinase dbf2 [Tilletia horrida]
MPPASRVLLPQSNSQPTIAIQSGGTDSTKDGNTKSPLISNTTSNLKENVRTAASNRANHTHHLAPTSPSVLPKSRSTPDHNQISDSRLASPDVSGAHAAGSWKSSFNRTDALQPWEREVLAKPEVARKANVAQLYFLNHYFGSLQYLAGRKERWAAFQQSAQARGLLPIPDDQPAATLSPPLSSASSRRSPRLASSVSSSPSLKALALTHPDPKYQAELQGHLTSERALLRKRRTRLQLEQFHIITQVGQGGYGEVFLARKRETGEVCALKRLKKSVLVKMDEVRHVLTERDILTATRTPWLVRLLYAFQDTHHVFLAMEFVPGGDFRTLLNNSGVLREEHARFYAAEMFVAVDCLHRLGYIHRDLKPENFLVDASGHIKLTDFGLAAGALNPTRIESLKHKLDQVKDSDFIYRTPAERNSLFKQMRANPATARHADSIVGSPDYMAPEVLRGKDYGYSVDYWSLGCILFEFLCGFPPFSGGTPEETWANLKNWRRVLQRPVYTKEQDLQFNLSDVAWDSVTHLIESADKRYASLPQVQAHPFFSSLDFTKLRTLTAPFKPQLESDEDTGYFDDFNNPEDMAKYKEVKEKQRNVDKVEEKGGAGGRGMWVGFTFGKNGVGANGKPLVHEKQGSSSREDVLATMF